MDEVDSGELSGGAIPFTAEPTAFMEWHAASCASSEAIRCCSSRVSLSTICVSAKANDASPRSRNAGSTLASSPDDRDDQSPSWAGDLRCQTGQRLGRPKVQAVPPYPNSVCSVWIYVASLEDLRSGNQPRLS